MLKITKVLKIFEGKIIELKKKEVPKKFILLKKCYSRYVQNIDPLPTRYGGKTNVTILPGTGIGPEIMDCALRVLKEAGAPLSFEILTLSSMDHSPEEFENVLTSIRRNRVALKGNIETKSKNPHESSRNILLRKTLDLFVYILSCKTYPGLVTRFGEMDVIVIRQNTEGEYLMLEHEPVMGSVESLKVISRYNSKRLAEYAFNYAIANNRKLITIVHNADVQVRTEGLFLEAALDVSKNYPSMKVEVLEVGVAVVKLMSNPKMFDIILATNLNGSMVSNFLNGMLGGPGLTSGSNYSDNGIAVFEPGARNKGSSIVGKGIANPVAMIMSGINLLNHLGHHKTAETIRSSTFATLVYDKIRSKDLGGKATSEEITENIIRRVRELRQSKSNGKTNQQLRGKLKSYCDISEENPPEKN